MSDAVGNPEMWELIISHWIKQLVALSLTYMNFQKSICFVYLEGHITESKPTNFNMQTLLPS